MSGTATCTARPAFGHALSYVDSAAVPPLCWAVSPCSWCSLAPSHIIANRRRCQRLHALTQVCQADWDAVTDCARCTLASWHVAYHAALLLTTPPPTTTPPPMQLVFIGALFGSGLFGFLCDSWGRRKPMFLATGLVAATMFAGLAAPSYWAMAALHGVAGIGAAGQTHTAALLSVEPVGPSYR